MNILMSSEQADALMAEAYAGDSRPLIRRSSVSNKHDMASWLESTRLEGNEHVRKYAAIQVYLIIAQKSDTRLPLHSFPAIMRFNDGQLRYPDKGLIKAMASAGHLTGTHVDEELIFVVSDGWF